MWVADLDGAVGLETWDGLVGEEDGEEIEADGLGLAEEFEQDVDAFFGRSDGLDGAFHALEGTVGDFDFITDEQRWGKSDEFGFVMGLLREFTDQGIDKRFSDGRDFLTKAHETANSLGKGDGAFHFHEIELGQHVTGEEGFEPPDFSTAGGFAVFDARAKNLDISEITQMFGGDVFAFGLGPNAEPLAGGWRFGVHWPRIFWSMGRTWPARFIQASMRSMRSLKKARSSGSVQMAAVWESCWSFDFPLSR